MQTKEKGTGCARVCRNKLLYTDEAKGFAEMTHNRQNVDSGVMGNSSKREKTDRLWYW